MKHSSCRSLVKKCPLTQHYEVIFFGEYKKYGSVKKFKTYREAYFYVMKNFGSGAFHTGIESVIEIKEII